MNPRRDEFGSQDSTSLELQTGFDLDLTWDLRTTESLPISKYYYSKASQRNTVLVRKGIYSKASK
jgi:hypothetical protein